MAATSEFHSWVSVSNTVCPVGLSDIPARARFAAERPLALQQPLLFQPPQQRIERALSISTPRSVSRSLSA
jgi:hypothetical protein